MGRGERDYLGMEPLLPGTPTSVWMDTSEEVEYPPLMEDVSVDTAVVGGGIAGILAALLLKEEGHKVALVEGRVLGGDVSGHTSAKLSLQHGAIYHHLQEKFGQDGAREYAEANTSGKELVFALADRLKIDCSLVQLPSYVYTAQKDTSHLKKEADAARKAGLPATFVDRIDCPFQVTGAVKIDDQAQFHPLRFLLPVAAQIPGDGSYIFEHTRAMEITKGDTLTVGTNLGDIRAKNVVVASHFPFFDEGHFYTKMYPKRVYFVGIRTSTQLPDGIYYSSDDRSYSWRTVDTQGGKITLVGGQRHNAGQTTNEVGHYMDLVEYAGRYCKDMEVVYHWSTQDNHTMDRVPFIGRSPKTDGVFVATGFNGWGMTSGATSAVIVRDLVTKGNSRWQKLFDPSRVKVMASVESFARENLNVAAEYLGKRSSYTVALEQIEPNQGALVKEDNRTVAVWKDSEGSPHRVSARCTHLGCHAKWNWAEKTWDCPCHGSRFSAEGKVIHGPAVVDLKKE